MFLSPEELLNWILTVSALCIALAGLLWTVYTHKRRGRIYRSKKLADKVFKRWIDASPVESPRGVQEFHVPDHQGRRGPGREIPLAEIAEFLEARKYLQKKHPQVAALWREAEHLMRRREEERRRHWAVVKKTVRRQMSHSFQELTPQQSRHPPKVDSYDLDTLTEKVHGRSYGWARDKKPPRFDIKQPSAGDAEGTEVWLVGNNIAHLRINLGNPPDIKEYERVLVSCVKDPDVVEGAKSFIDASSKLDRKQEEFRLALQKVIVDIELESE